MRYFILLTIACWFQLGIAQDFFTIDPAQSSCTWTGYAELGVWTPEGSINLKQGTCTIQNGNIISALVLFDMKSIEHEIPKLQRHLRGEAFFGVKKYPEAQFQFTRQEGDQVYGNLTIKDQTHPIVLAITLTQSGSNLIIEGSATVDRTKYGITYNSESYFDVGDQAIKNEFDLRFRLLASPTK